MLPVVNCQRFNRAQQNGHSRTGDICGGGALSCTDYRFLTDRITATEALIVAYEDAVAGLVSGAIHQYSIDTGQSRQSVTKTDVNILNRAIEGLYNRRATLIARRDGCGTVTTRPSW